MILVDVDIKRALESGDLVIDPFESSNLGVNSYDVRLGDHLLTYDFRRSETIRLDDEHGTIFTKCLDPKKVNPVIDHRIPEEGLVLVPGRLYLGETLEAIDSHGVIPMMDGRSSIGRLGISVHVTAGFGDLGFCGKWTMEITAVHPVKVYAGMRIAQVWWAYPSSKTGARYSGKYQYSGGVVPSKIQEDKEFNLESED